MVHNQVTSFESILHDLADQGGFQAVALVSADGLPLAWATAEKNRASRRPFEEDELAAMVSLVRDVIEMAQKRLGMGAVDEVSVVTDEHQRLVCRYFEAGSEALILVLVAPPRQTYRRLTSVAIRAIQRAW